MTDNKPWRRRAETFDVGPFTVTVGLDAPEVFFLARGKTGHDLENFLRQASIGMSKLLQGEDFTEDDMLGW